MNSSLARGNSSSTVGTLAKKSKQGGFRGRVFKIIHFTYVQSQYVYKKFKALLWIGTTSEKNKICFEIRTRNK